MEPDSELALKAAVLVEGLRVDESAMERVGTHYHPSQHSVLVINTGNAIDAFPALLADRAR